MVDGFFKKVKDAIVGDEGFDQSAEQDQQGFFTGDDEYRDRGQYGDVRPASEDPYGDPGSYEAGAGYGHSMGMYVQLAKTLMATLEATKLLLAMDSMGMYVQLAKTPMATLRMS